MSRFRHNSTSLFPCRRWPSSEAQNSRPWGSLQAVVLAKHRTQKPVCRTPNLLRWNRKSQEEGEGKKKKEREREEKKKREKKPSSQGQQGRAALLWPSGHFGLLQASNRGPWSTVSHVPAATRLLSQGARLLQEVPAVTPRCSARAWTYFRWLPQIPAPFRIVFNCHSFIRPPSYQVSALSLPMPYAVPSYFNQGASNPGKQPLGRLVSIRGLPRPSSPEAVGVACTNTDLQVNQHSCSFPLAESGTRREYRQDLSTRKLMSWLSFDGFCQACLTCPALGYRALGVGPWRSAGQGIRRLSPFCPAAVSDPQLPFSVSSSQDLRVTGTWASLSWTCNKNFRAFFFYSTERRSPYPLQHCPL